MSSLRPAGTEARASRPMLSGVLRSGVASSHPLSPLRGGADAAIRDGGLVPATQSTPVYGGRAIVNFYEHNHRYVIEVPKMGLSLEQPSMTTVLKGMGELGGGKLLDWAAENAAAYILENLPEGKVGVIAQKRLMEGAIKAHTKSRDRSGGIGTIVHATVEQMLHNGLHDDLACGTEDLDTEGIVQVEKSVAKAKRWLSSNNVIPRGIERAFWSPSLGVVGTADLPAVVNGRLAITDWKISKWIGLKYRLQLTGYAALFEEEFRGEKILDRRVVAFGANGDDPKVEVWTRDTFDGDVAQFKRVVEDWRWLIINDSWYRGKTNFAGPLTPAQLEEFWAIEPTNEKREAA